jgi:hypothetical protein
MSLIEAPRVTVVEEQAVSPVAPWTHSPAYARQVHLTLLGLALVVLAAARLLTVEGETLVTLPLLEVTLPELCYWKQAFGMGCPGCGLTRCFISLAHFDPVSAWRFNPAGMLLFAGVASQVPFRLLQLRRLRCGLPELDSQFFVYGLVAVCILLVLQWLLQLFF